MILNKMNENIYIWTSENIPTTFKIPIIKEKEKKNRQASVYFSSHHMQVAGLNTLHCHAVALGIVSSCHAMKIAAYFSQSTWTQLFSIS